MSLTTTEMIYEQIVKLLPAAERWRLVEKIAHDLSTLSAENGSSDNSPDNPSDSNEWMSLRGIAPNLLEGVDAQTWVTQSRQAASETREQQWRSES